MLNKHYGIANIKNYPLSKIADFLRFAHEREIYERWLTMYPFMEMGIMPFMSFEEYKKKLKENTVQAQRNYMLTNEEIVEDGMKIMQIYERNQQKAGDKVGNI